MRPRGAASIFLLFASLYVLTMGGRTYSPDDTARYDMAVAMVERGTIEIPPSPCAAAATNDGRTYSKYGLGKPLLIVPLHLIGRALERAGAAPGILTAPMAASMLDQILAAATVALLFLVAAEMGFGPRAAVAVALTCGVATMLWPMSKFAFEHPMVTVLLLGAFLSLLRFRERGGAGRAGIAGLCLGAVLATRASDFACAIAPLGLYFASAPRRGKRRGLALAAFVLPILFGASVVLAYNLARFDDPFESGYDDLDYGPGFLPNGLFGLLLSPGKSVFIWNPPLVAALLAYGAYWRRRRAEALVGLGIAGAFLAGHAPLRFWHGDWCVGPRYLLPAVPFLLLALGAGLSGGAARRRVTAALSVTVPLGILVALLGLSVDYWPYFERFRNDVDGRNFVPDRTQLVVYWEFLREGRLAFFWRDVMRNASAPLWLKGLVAVPVAGVIAGALSVRRLAAGRSPDVRLEGAAGIEDGPPAAEGAGRSAAVSDVGAGAEAGLALASHEPHPRRLPPVAAWILVGLLAAGIAAAVALDRAGGGRTAGPRGAAGGARGLLGRYFEGTEWRGEPVFTRVDPRIDFHWGGRRRPIAGPFSVEWTGDLEVPESGTYTFFLRSRDGSWLEIDSAVVIDNGGLHGVRQIARNVRLEAGRHSIRLRAFDTAFGGARLRLAWKKEGRFLPSPVMGGELRSSG